MSFITARDHFLQMTVLRLYDLISGIAMVWQITWSTQLLTCHCFHNTRFLSKNSILDVGTTLSAGAGVG